MIIISRNGPWESMESGTLTTRSSLPPFSIVSTFGSLI